jgi:hypothetical protein
LLPSHSSLLTKFEYVQGVHTRPGYAFMPSTFDAGIEFFV